MAFDPQSIAYGCGPSHVLGANTLGVPVGPKAPSTESIIAQSPCPASSTTEPPPDMMSVVVSSDRHQLVPLFAVNDAQFRQAAFAPSDVQEFDEIGRAHV